MKAENSERLDRERTFKELAATVNKKSAPQIVKSNVVNRKVVRKRKSDDFWVNISVMVFISLCLLVLGWEMLLNIS